MESIHTARLAGDLRRGASVVWRQRFRAEASVAVVLMILVLGLLPARADAATYVVHACRLPNGAAAPTFGWGTRSEGAIASTDGCSGGGGLSIRFLDGAQPNTMFQGSWADWVFTAPPDTRISAYSIYRHAAVHVSPGPPGEASEYKHYVDNYVWEFNRDYCNPSV